MPKKTKRKEWTDFFDDESFLYYSENIVAFVEDIVFKGDPKLKLSSQQAEMLESIARYKRTAVKSGRGVGKCLDENEQLLMADGSYKIAKDLVGKNFKVHSFDASGKACIKDATAFDNGEKPIYYLKTRLGHELYRTDNHPLLTYSGWKNMEDLKEGDSIAFPTKIEHVGKKEYDDNLFKLFGYIIGDGCISSASGVKFSQEDNKQLREFDTIVQQYDCYLRSYKEYDYTVHSNNSKKGKHQINRLVRELYHFKTNSWHKDVPKFVFTAPKDQIALFLSRLYSCDGWIYSTKEVLEVGYCSVSKQLAIDVQRLLKRFNIVARVRKKKTCYTYKGVKHKSFAYCVEFRDVINAKRFIDEIGIYGKEENIARANDIITQRLSSKNNTNMVRQQYNIFPKEAKEDIVKKYGYKKCRNEYNVRNTNQSGITKNRLLKIKETEELPSRIDYFLNLEAGFDEIEEIIYCGESKTVGITVEGTHVYTNDVFEHNTATIAFACIWWLCMHPRKTKFYCTAPSLRTLKTSLWNEICMWLEDSLVSELFEIGAEKITLIEKPNSCYAEARTARSKEAMSGMHADNLLIISDEASGTEDDILRTLDATLTGGRTNKFVLITNPTRISGYFYDTFHKDKNRWHTFTFSAEDSPHVDPETIQAYENKYGRTHPLFLIDILGEFPPENNDSFLSLHEVQMSMDRDVIGEGEVEIGVDVARFGDDSSVVYWRHGYKVYPRKKLSKCSTIETAELVLRTVVEARATSKYEGIIKVKVDDTGVGGGVTDILRLDRQNKIDVIPCNFGGVGNETYQNEASNMWGTLKDCIGLVELPNEIELKEELAARKWNLSPSGKITIQPKRDYKKEYGSSPDNADALILCFARKVAERVVLKEFDPLDTSIIKDKLGYTGEDVYASLYYTSDLYVSIIYAAWDGNKLTVYGEYNGDDPLPYIASNVVNHQPFKRIIGNNRMFKKGTDDIANKFRKFKLNLYDNWSYDELGAIETMGLLVSQKRILIYRGCKNTIDQMTKWRMEGSKYALEKDFGLCYAISNIVSLLKKKIEGDDMPMATPTYVPQSVRDSALARLQGGGQRTSYMAR